ncbi:Sua5/YciO/YrdC/YwlC family protein [Candidatus Methanoperedens nitroreducens]|uniref:L-threonylcarbamoyladenylate synthase n=1 Tax=Candidatus Methanoperedens nitratireducens TaxID=1392998 RepID=A0A062V6K7_9EURY|nr:L-threonylcarbamoyladenylate synthase [Candidatus Methanoperedens nitroreducens]KCZ71020.1 Sua5/YciO/YrdC/YwlC family protein [Candidatus Methanoperedens nitroreducens]MDJ1421610.1 L-threonylcarbamoyladenylate synthase [Candidatus Methanoperedens sp.]
MLKVDTIGKDIKKAADIIRRGGIVIYPTETVYGIGANIFSEDALKKIFAIKKRTEDKPISVAVSDFRMMEKLVYTGDRERRFIGRFLPGPVTVLLKKKEIVPDVLTPGTDLIGIRYPEHKIAIKLIELAGVPITSTSANISGEAPPKRVAEIKIDADYILDGGDCTGEPSTVVDLVNWRILRTGAKYDEVLAALREI